MLSRAVFIRKGIASQSARLSVYANELSTRPVFSRRFSKSSLLATQTMATNISVTDPRQTRKSMYERISLEDKVTVVTGGSRGIGLAIAEATAELGSNVALLDRIEPSTDTLELERLYGSRFKFYRTDVTQPESLTNSFDSVMKDFGKIDNCVTAAGIALDKPFLEHTWEESKRILDVNVLGTFFSAQLAAKHMLESGREGSIVMIASIAAHSAIPGQRVSIYGASKGAVKLLGMTLAVELAPFKIRVNTLSPGFINTDMTGSMTATQPELLQIFTKTPPLGRMGERDDLTPAVVYLLSDAASYTTGADLPVTGGIHGGRIQVSPCSE